MNIYREQIIELYRNPMHKGTCQNPTHFGEEKNPLCGDELSVELVIDNDVVVDAKFQGTACAISTAGASLLLDGIIGKNVEEIKKIGREDIEEMLGVKLDPVRTRCATICLGALRRALEKSK